MKGESAKIFFMKAKAFFIENKKKIIIRFSIFSLFFMVIMFIFNFGAMVGVILTLALKPKFTIDKIKFDSPGVILGKNVELSYKGQIIVDAPKVKIEYQLTGPLKGWLKKISVYNPDVLIERKGSNVNIVDAFSTGNNDSKAGTGVPIGIIETIGGNVIYRDLSYEFPIEKNIEKLQGHVSFDEKKGIDLIFQGKNKGEDISYSFTNYDENYSMTIKGKNIDADTNIMQFAYYYKDVEYLKGKVDLDLTIASSGLYGTAEIKAMEVKYKDFHENAKNINGSVKFLKKEIKIVADYDLFEKKRKFTLDFENDKELLIKILLGKMSYSEVSKYELLNKLNWPLEKYNFDNVDVTLKLDKKKEFYVIVDYKISDIISDSFTAINNVGNLIYHNNVVDINLFGSDLNISGFANTLKGNFKIKNSVGNLEYEVGGFKGIGQLKFNKEELEIILSEGFLKTKGSFNYKTRELNFKNYDEKDEKYFLCYDFKNYNLKKYEGILKINLFEELEGKIEAKGEDNLLELVSFNIQDKKGVSILESFGKFNFRISDYKYYFDTFLLPIDQKIKNQDLKILASVSGVYSKKQEDNSLDLYGTLERIEFMNFKSNGFKLNLRIKDNIFQIINCFNGYFSINGSYDLLKEKIEADFNIFDLTNEKIPFKNFEYNIVKGSGKISGEVKNPQINFKLDEGLFKTSTGKNIVFNGDLSYFNKNFIFNEIVINKTSLLKGEYNLLHNSYSLVGNILEESLSEYIPLSNSLKYRLIGKIALEGKGEKLNLNSEIGIDNIYLKGYEFPKIKTQINYSAENLNDGSIKFANVDFIKDGYKIGTATGEIDLKNKNINLSMGENSIDLSKIFKNEKFLGNLFLNFSLNGSLENPRYNLDFYSPKIFFSGEEFEEISFSLNGDAKETVLEHFKFYYQKNLLEAKGKYEFKNENYSLNVDSKDIKLDFFDIVLAKYGIKDISGNAQFNLLLTDKGNKGHFIGENIIFDTGDIGIKSKNLNFNFILNEDRFNIQKFDGIVNDGKMVINGYVTLPTITEIKENPYFFEKMDYDLSFVMYGVNYAYKDYFNIVLNSDLRVNLNKVTGALQIQNGNLKGIPGVAERFNVLKIIKDYMSKTSTTTVLTEENKAEEVLIAAENKMSFDVDFKILEGIKTDIPAIYGVIEDIQGILIGKGKLKGETGKINFLGDFEVKNGEYTLGDSSFKINIARLIFGKEFEYFPTVNPTLIFESYSRTITDNTEISLNGELKSLNFKIKTNRENSSGNLAALFKDERNLGGDTNNIGTTSLVLQNLINAQLSGTFLSPISRKIRDIFGFTKLKISSNINTNANEKSFNVDNINEDINYSIGAKIQLENAIYKDKLYLLANTLISTSSTSEVNNSVKNDSFNKYNGELEYRIDEEKSIGIGLEKYFNKANKVYISGDKNKEKNANNINYYIDFKIEKKYDSLGDIFKSLFN